MKHTPHNPDKLTDEQIGTREGWRLMSREEIQSRRNCYHAEGMIKAWDGHKWFLGGCFGSSVVRTYRTNQPLGYWLCNKAGERIGDPDAVWADELPAQPNAVNTATDPRRFELIKAVAAGYGFTSYTGSNADMAKCVIGIADAILDRLNKEGGQ